MLHAFKVLNAAGESSRGFFHIILLSLKNLPCPILTITFILVAFQGLPDEAQTLRATIQTTQTITQDDAADSLTWDRVGELCCLLFIYRFEPHALQVCSSTPLL